MGPSPLHSVPLSCHHLYFTCFITKIINSHTNFLLSNSPIFDLLDWVPPGLYSTSSALPGYRSLYFLLFNQHFLSFPHFPPEITSLHDSLFQQHSCQHLNSLAILSSHHISPAKPQYELSNSFCMSVPEYLNTARKKIM